MLDIKLHTRVALEQLWRVKDYFPLDIQQKLRRELDRRNRMRKQGKTFTFARN